jgi:hypothetical protein
MIPATNPRAGLPATPPQCSGSALHAHITRAAQLQSALTDIERRICRERIAAREFADVMLGIVLAVEQCDYWLAHIMGRS